MREHTIPTICDISNSEIIKVSGGTRDEYDEASTSQCTCLPQHEKPRGVHTYNNCDAACCNLNPHGSFIFNHKHGSCAFDWEAQEPDWDTKTVIHYQPKHLPCILL